MSYKIVKNGYSGRTKKVEMKVEKKMIKAWNAAINRKKYIKCKEL